MNHLKIYTREYLLNCTNKRKGEIKLGETLAVLPKKETLKNQSQKYVLLGIPEDIGIRANHGRPGSEKAWQACLTSLCNIQDNSFINSDSLLVLGEIDCRMEMESAASIDTEDEEYVEKLGKIVLRIDTKVFETIAEIILAGKIPIIIGGGHNNSYGNLRGTSEALGTPVNCINLDAHSDFRPLEHRHSGNGFSYAKKEGFLNKFFIFGLHPQYNSQDIFDRISAESETIQFTTFEELFISERTTLTEAKTKAEKFCCSQDFGLEIDLDTIANMGSSAMNPVGFSVTETRNFVSHFSKNKNCRYIHLAEGSPNLEMFPNQVGKVLGYLVCDIINN